MQTINTFGNYFMKFYLFATKTLTLYWIKITLNEKNHICTFVHSTAS